MGDRFVVEVVRFEAVPSSHPGSRRVVVRWSDETISEALRWYSDEVLVSEGDVLGKTQADLRHLLFLRDRDHLRRDDDTP